jgi:hypothetical protein
VPGQISQRWESVFSGKLKPPPQVAALLQPYRRYNVATNQG